MRLKNPVVTLAAAVLAIAVVSSSAEAAIWGWGCISKPVPGQVVFSRHALLEFSDQPTRLTLARVATSTQAIEDDNHSASFEPADINSGFEPRLEFVRVGDSKQKLVLTEKSSRRISSRTGRAGPRDETRTVWRKVYRYALDGEAARDITMDCMEYMLSTKGGRN